ncbi:MAG: 6-carboxytetrahydropterin synthase [Alistipes sp.]|nr:6-carboxytetrahydropterin synthase [Candidatus Alistipes equi]
MIRLTKEFTFEMAHALDGYEGKCSNLHGHSYHLWVCVEGVKNDANGMVMDFHRLRLLVQQSIIESFDHSLLLSKTKENEEVIDFLKKRYGRVHAVDYIPTTENILEDFARILKAVLPANVKLHSLKLQETETSYAEWFDDLI